MSLHRLLISFVVVCSPFVITAGAEPKRYDGHQLVRLTIADENDLRRVVELEEGSEDFDIWTHGVGIGEIDVRVSPEQKQFIDASGLKYHVLKQDLQQLIDASQGAVAGGSFYDAFRTNAEYATFMNGLATTYPALAGVYNFGTSLQGRAVSGLRISGPGTNKRAVFMFSCEHAREWVTPPVIAYLAEHLLTNYSTNPRIAELVDNVEWFLLPIHNPDGYEYSWTTDRYWRKNRRNNGDGTFGVDLNRNWARGFGGQGSSGTTSSQTYRGLAAFSEPETDLLRDFIEAHPNLRAHMDIHSYSNLLLWPWGYQSALPPAQATYNAIGSEMAARVLDVHGTSYTYGPVYSTIYPASGVSVDWTYGDRGIWSFSIECRGFDFVVPPSEIILAAEENLPALLYLAAWTADCNNNGVDDGKDIADGTSLDSNFSDIPDECESGVDPCTCPVPAPVTPEGASACTSNAQCNPPFSSAREGACINGVCYTPSNRYLSFEAPPLAPGANTMALRVILGTMPPEHSAYQGDVLWVGPASPSTGVSRLQASAYYSASWQGEAGYVRVSDCNIVPGAQYVVQSIFDACFHTECNFSVPISLPTVTTWGDVTGALENGLLSPPDSMIDFLDIGAVVDRFRAIPAVPVSLLPRCDVCANVPTQGGGSENVDFIDISCVVDAFRGLPYPHPGPAGPTGTCTLP